MINNSSQQLSIKGNLLIFMAMLAFTAYGIISKKKSEKINASPVALTFYFSLFGLLFSLPMAIYEYNSGIIIWSEIFPLHWPSAVAAGVTGITLFYLVYQNAIKAGGGNGRIDVYLPAADRGHPITGYFIGRNNYSAIYYWSNSGSFWSPISNEKE